MSAYLSVCYEDRIELLTDGAVYSPDGTLTDIRTKVFPFMRKPMAITGRGPVGLCHALAASIMVMTDHARFTVDQAIDTIVAFLEKRKHGEFPEPVEILIAAISETRGPMNLLFTTAEVYPEIEPWSLYDVSKEFGGGPGIGPADLAAAGIDLKHGADGLLPIGVGLFEIMRGKLGAHPCRPDLPMIHGIGGHIDLTVLRPGGVTVDRIHTWDDQIGRKIEPARIEAVAA